MTEEACCGEGGAKGGSRLIKQSHKSLVVDRGVNEMLDLGGQRSVGVLGEKTPSKTEWLQILRSFVEGISSRVGEHQ